MTYIEPEFCNRCHADLTCEICECPPDDYVAPFVPPRVQLNPTSFRVDRAPHPLAQSPKEASTMSNSTAQISAADILSALMVTMTGPTLSSSESARAMAEYLGTDMPDAYSATPLWMLFGWERVEFKDGDLPDWGAMMGQPNAESDYDAQFDDAVLPYINEFGTPLGKFDVAIRPIESSAVFDLGDAHWRLIDFVRATTTRPTNPYLLKLDKNILLTKGDKALGDGVFARVRPETIGYTRKLRLHEDTYLQVRAFVWDSDAVCRKVFKGLIHVTNETTQEFFAPEAGYGPHVMTIGDTVEIHPMVDVLDYNPGGRVSDQLGKYAGIQDWYTRYAPGMTLALNERFEGSRMMRAGCPIGFLPANEAMRIGFDAFAQLTSIQMGVRRKAAPGLDLKPFTFRAPWEMSGTFQVGHTYTVHRDPALPDGTSSWSGKCVGYTAGNYFHLPTAASPLCKLYSADGSPLMVRNDKGELIHAAAEYGVWEQGGGDFDGDDVLMLPHVSNGGIILGFNDRSESEQAELRLAAGRAGRTKKENYPSGLERWKRQRQRAVELGMLDFRARKLIDSAPDGKLLAAAIKPYIQAAVDGQKRITDYPTPLSELPRMSGDFGTQVLSALKKTKSDLQPDKTDWKHSWDLLEVKAEQARKLLSAESDGLQIAKGQLEALQPVAEWALAVWDAVKTQLMRTTTKYGDGTYPRANMFPHRQITSFTRSRVAEMQAKGFVLADASELLALEAQIVKARKNRPASARAAEAMVADLIKNADEFDAVELSMQLTDAQLWLKAAPMVELITLFSQPEFGHKRVSDLPGVIVTGMGKPFKLGGDRAVSTRTLTFSGCVYAAGSVTIEERVVSHSAIRPTPSTYRQSVKHELVMLSSGIELARTVGSFANFSEVSRTLLAAVPRKASQLLVDQLGGLGHWPVELITNPDDNQEAVMFEQGEQYACCEPTWEDAI